VIEKRELSGQRVLVGGNVFAEEGQALVSVPLLHIAQIEIVGVVLLDDVDYVLEGRWFADSLGDWDRRSPAPRRKLAAPMIVLRHLARQAGEVAQVLH